jgi:hypothetical protein
MLFSKLSQAKLRRKFSGLEKANSLVIMYYVHEATIARGDVT